MSYRLVKEQWISLQRDQVFDFFKRPENLEAITPSHLKFAILTPSPVSMHEGSEIEYTIQLFGIPMKWKTLISIYNPPHSFSDSQAKGPYKKWEHQHIFEDHGERTKVIDIVDYEMPFWFFGKIAHFLFVKRQLQHIFDFRYRKIEEVFSSSMNSGRESDE